MHLKQRIEFKGAQSLNFLQGEQEVIPSSRFSFVNGVITVESVSMGDRGEYRCEAENALGRISKNVSVKLSGNSTKLHDC